MTAVELAAVVHLLGLPTVYAFVSSELVRALVSSGTRARYVATTAAFYSRLPAVVAAVSGVVASVDTDSGTRVYRALFLFHVLYFALAFDAGDDDFGGRGLGGRLRRRARSLLTSATPLASPS